jgi:hypothetical protein
MVQGFHT